MIGWKFSAYTPDEEGSTFDKLFKLFQELLVHTSGDVSEALAWLNELDREYKLTDDNYGMADFIQDLIDKGYIQQEGRGEGSPGFVPSSKLELALRRKALEDVFGQLKKSKSGNHNTRRYGRGDEHTSELRPFEFGDPLEHLAVSESLRNAQINHGIDEFRLSMEDLEVKETFYQAQMSTVLMIDISHSMILYGEDRITPAKKVAMALSELITTRYPKDTLDVIVFGNDAWQIEIKDLPYLQVGPYHTNTVAGLELAMDILKKRKNPNKQIFPEQLWIGPHHRQPHAQPRHAVQETSSAHHHFYDCPRSLSDEFCRSVYPRQQRQGFLQQPQRPGRFHFYGL